MGQSRDTYPIEAKNVLDNPMEAGNVLDNIAPRPGSVFPRGVPPQSWWDFKDDVYDKIGLKFGFSYQMLFQSASDVAPNATYDTALGDWWGFMTKWTMLSTKGGIMKAVSHSACLSAGGSATMPYLQTSDL